MKKINYILGVLSLFVSSTSFAYYAFGPRHIFQTTNESIAIGLNVMHFNYREAIKEVSPSRSKDNLEQYGNAFGVFINYRNVFFDEWVILIVV